MTARTQTRRLVVAMAVALTTAALAAVSLAATASAAPSAATDRTDVGSIAKLPEHTQVLGALAATRRLALTVSLEPRDPAALARYATAVSTPGNPNYGRFLNVSHFAARFGAPRSHIAAVRRTLRGAGLTIGHLDRNDLTLAVSGPASTVEHAFGVSLFAVRVDGRRAFANGSAATLPSSIARDVEAVNGFDDVTLEHSIGLQRPARAHAGLRRSVASAPQVATNGGPQPCAAALPRPRRATERADRRLDRDRLPVPGAVRGGRPRPGADRRADRDRAVQRERHRHLRRLLRDQPGRSPRSPSPAARRPTTNDGETALDIEVVQGMAPKTTIDVYEGQAQITAAPATWSAAISGPAKVISASLGVCEAHEMASVTSAENTLFQEAAAQGQTLLASSGDQGSAACDVGSAPTTRSRSTTPPASRS